MYSQYYCYVFIQFVVLFDELSHANPLKGMNVLPAEKDEFPFVVSLRNVCNMNDKNKHICGGTLISPKHVLTSAHCFEDIDLSCVSVVVGSIYLKSGQMYNLKTGITYDEWAKENNFLRYYIDNDIAIVTLSQKVIGIEPAVISKLKMNEIFTKKVVTAGWGDIDPCELKEPYSLRKAYMNVLSSREYVFNEIKLYGYADPMPLNTYFTSANPPVVIACGDSGGPLLLASDKKQIVGINDASCDIKNAENNPYAMSVHLAVDCYRDFIESVIKE